MRTATSFWMLAGVAALPFVASADAGRPVEGESAACRRLVSDVVNVWLPPQQPQPPQRPKEEQSILGRIFDGDSAAGDSAEPMPSAEASTRDESPPSVEEKPQRPMEPKKDSSRANNEGGGGKRGATAATGPSNFSRTNTQEQAVDEGDIVKTDGRVIYHVSCNRDGNASGCRNELRIYSSWPAKQTKLLARYAIPQREQEAVVKQIYLYGNQVAVLMAGQSRDQSRSAINSDLQVSRLLLLDVSVPSTPRIVREMNVEGTLIESRMIGSRLYLATSTPQLILPPEMYQELIALRGRNPTMKGAELISQLSPRWSNFINRDPGLPHARELGGSWDDPASKPMYSCSDVHVANTVGAARMLNVVQIDLATKGDVIGAGVSGYSAQSTVYASEGAFYVADPTTPTTPGWYSATLVRKFALGRGGKPRFESSGVVRGQLLNQFSLSEHKDHLRVATSDQWVSNNLYVLRSSGQTLETVGTLENLGRNERIYSVRLMGNRGYIVTFRRTDPLYTLDLSNPNQPQLVGELHIAGYSNYLHPLGKNHLLAIGQDADASGRALGLHLQIFDVSDPRSPQRKFHEKLDAASVSDAQSDHHAFMFEPETNTLSVPWKSENYWGLIAYRVDPREGFKNLGRVNHALMYKSYFQKVCVRADVAECGKRNFWYTFVTRPAIAVDRIIAIDDQLYSMSPTGMMVHRAGNKLTLTTSVLVSEPSWRGSRSTSVASW